MRTRYSWASSAERPLYGSLQAKRELLTEEGEFASKDDIKFDPNANIKRGIPYYPLVARLFSISAPFASCMASRSLSVSTIFGGVLPVSLSRLIYCIPLGFSGS